MKFLLLSLFFIISLSKTSGKYQPLTKTKRDNSTNTNSTLVTAASIMNSYPPYMYKMLNDLFEEGKKSLKESSRSKRTLTGADVVGNFLSPLGTTVSAIHGTPSISTIGNNTYYYIQLLWVGFPMPNGIGARSEYGFRTDQVGTLYQYLYVQSYQGTVYPFNVNPGVSIVFSVGSEFLLEKTVTSTSSLSISAIYDAWTPGYPSYPYISYHSYVSELSGFAFQYPKTFGGIQIGQSYRYPVLCSEFDESISQWSNVYVCDYKPSPSTCNLSGGVVYSSTYPPTCGTGSVVETTTSIDVELKSDAL